jgi:hypothetical protein
MPALLPRRGTRVLLAPPTDNTKWATAHLYGTGKTNPDGTPILTDDVIRAAVTHITGRDVSSFDVWPTQDTA